MAYSELESLHQFFKESLNALINFMNDREEEENYEREWAEHEEELSYQASLRLGF